MQQAMIWKMEMTLPILMDAIGGSSYIKQKHGLMRRLELKKDCAATIDAMSTI